MPIQIYFLNQADDQKAMRVLAITAFFFSVLLQALIVWYWTNTQAVQGFLAALQSFYGEVPVWSKTAFSFGMYWWAVPAVLLGAVTHAVAKNRPSAYVWKAFGISILFLRTKRVRLD